MPAIKLGAAEPPTIDGLAALPHHKTPKKIPVGERHFYLVDVGQQLVTEVRSEHELFLKLKHERDANCEDPTSKPDHELDGIAAWWWKNRLENRLYQGRDSAFPMSRIALDLLRGDSDAEHLYVRLCDKHGHAPGKTFGLDHGAMREAKLTDLSRDRFRRARDKLLSVGLLQIAENHIAGKRYRQYRLCRPLLSPECP
ncbi:hypothetical protein [Marimonas lutisalis]|uniref:hypothetical protein n=1 Tax=Marimonas lutisalis TaxID=2545756 RepID=UPI0010F939C9|nr:hypothetical protein [Marimonas lutisalis]